MTGSLLVFLLLTAPQAAPDEPLDAKTAPAVLEQHDRAWAAGEVQAAEAALARVVAWQVQAYGQDPLRLAGARVNLGVHLRNRHHLEPAQELLEEAMALSEEHLGPTHPDVARAVRELAIVRELRGDYLAARALYERALSVHEAAPEPSPLHIAMLDDDLGILLIRLGEYAEARTHLERALAVWEASLPPDDPRLVNALNNQGALLYEMRDLAAARAVVERLLALREASLPADDPMLAAARQNLATILFALGEFSEALALHELALDAYERSLGPHSQEVAQELNNLAVTLEALGRLEEALVMHRRALEVYESLYGAEHPEVARSLASQARALLQLERYAESRPLYERALAMQERLLGSDHTEVARTLQSIAITVQHLEGGDAALRLYERARAIHEERDGGPMAADLANLEFNVSAIHWDAGRLQPARAALERSLAILEARSPEHPLVLEVLRRLTLLALDEDRPDLAWAHARDLASRQRRLRRILAGLTEDESFDFLAGLRGQLAAILSAADAAGEPEAAYDAVLEVKGRVARLTLQTRDSLRAALDEDTAALSDALAGVQARLASLALATPDRQDSGHAERQATLRDERVRLERALRRRADLDDGHAPLTARDVAAALPPRSALVDLLVESRREPGRLIDGRFCKGGWSELVARAWIVRADREQPTVVVLGPAAPLREAIDAFLRELRSQMTVRGVSPLRPESGERDPGSLLFGLVGSQLTAHLDGIDTVFVSPEGDFGRLPFETLRGADGRYLIEDRAFVYFSDASVLVERAAAPAPLGGILLALGAPDYDHGGATDRRDGAAAPVPLERAAAIWPPLPGTGREVRAIAAIHEHAMPTGERRMLMGSDAGEESLRRGLRGASIVHLATHGYFGVLGGEAGSPTQVRSDVPDVAPRSARADPDVLSGLVLAGADAARDPGEAPHDGYLTAGEVAVLDLDHADLVVLSACETGLGTPQAGEGLLGLRRAFHLAGADTVVSSLWSVPDESTARLMEAFYQRLLVDGLPRHAALRATQLELLARNRAEEESALPGTWGAFVLSGEWR